eukprot:Amastigsp_a341317_87.p2 type:complete len:103 gc:universal Amastigsp_a341317_87:204-512(+)
MLVKSCSSTPPPRLRLARSLESPQLTTAASAAGADAPCLRTKRRRDKAQCCRHRRRRSCPPPHTHTVQVKEQNKSRAASGERNASRQAHRGPRKKWCSDGDA